VLNGVQAVMTRAAAVRIDGLQQLQALRREMYPISSSMPGKRVIKVSTDRF
jgi:hypothetical protein